MGVALLLYSFHGPDREHVDRFQVPLTCIVLPINWSLIVIFFLRCFNYFLNVSNLIINFVHCSGVCVCVCVCVFVFVCV